MLQSSREHYDREFNTWASQGHQEYAKDNESARVRESEAERLAGLRQGIVDSGQREKSYANEILTPVCVSYDYDLRRPFGAPWGACSGDCQEGEAPKIVVQHIWLTPARDQRRFGCSHLQAMRC